MKRFFLFAALILMPALPLTAHAADATSFNPTTVKVTAKPISSIPVGTIISWPVAQNPADWQNPDGSYNWLECNGQTISQAAYPELFALMGGKLPDLRGLFLRGHGGSSAGLGTKQGESVYIAPGSAEASVAAGLTTIRVADGAGTSSDDQGRPKPSYNVLAASKNDSPGIGGNPRPQYEINGPISITSSANETRPVNQAVRYLVRARP